MKQLASARRIGDGRPVRFPSAAWAVLAFLCAALPASGQGPSVVWQDVKESAMTPPPGVAVAKRTVIPRKYRTVRINRGALGAALGVAPREFSAAANAAAELALPMPEGGSERFVVEESPVMGEKLAPKYPEIKTYIARGIDDPSLTARLDVTPQGFHAIIFSQAGTVYIDPYWRGDATHHLAYRAREYRNDAKGLNCLIEAGPAAAEAAVMENAAARPTGASLRVYRTAVACTGEYAAAAGGGTVNGALGAIVTTINRVSAVYERDLAIRLKLVDNNDLLVFTNSSTDPYSNSNASALLTENQTTIDNLIGSANYDIGHVFSTGGGGLASLGVVCRAGLKARGETGSSDPVGDPYDIDYVAHEMGHQFGGNHPFNGTSGNCTGTNRNASTAYEPGSGTTIMAYAGICAPQNLAPNSDDYFHTISYDEIDAYTTTGNGTCGTSVATGNTPPTVAAPAAHTIPVSTPFALTATASDPDAGEVLTYCWEEFDKGAAQDPTASPRDNGASPIFRSFAPSRSDTRLFPSLTYILNNANVPPATVGGYATGEILPSTNRTMTFRVTVRDNRAGGGGSNYASTTVTSTAAAGPFALTSHNSAATIAGGSSQTVTWSVAGTTASPVSCANVKISLSTDGGNTFPFVLAASTPNDGSQPVTIPNVANVATTQGRIKVEAVGNIFFDISDASLTVTSSNTAPSLAITGGVTVKRGTPTPVTATVATVSDADSPLTVSVSNVPDDATVTAVISGTNVVASAVADCSLTTTNSSRTYPVTLTVADSIGSTTSGTFNLVVQPNTAPTVGTYSNQTVSAGATATITPSAAPADANGNLGATPVSILPTTLPGGGTLSANQVTGAITAATQNTTTAGTYSIRVTVQDTCGAAVVKTFNLTVQAAAVVIVPATASAPTSESCAPANGATDPTETVTINFGLTNTGSVASSNLVATLQNSGGVTRITTSQNYGVVAASATVSRAFQFTANGACGGTVIATFQLQDGATSLGTAAFAIPLGVFQTNSGTLQNFDGVTAPALPSGWSAAVATGTAAAWAASTTTPDTSPNAVFANSTSTVSDNRLESAPVTITGTAAQVSFKHRWNLEDGFDGGVLEISIGGGGFTDILAAGGSFASGGYNRTISTAYSSPIGGRQAWSGDVNSSYSTTTVNLPAAAAGQSIRLRWRLGCDSSEVATIWRVDSITLSDGYYACSSCGTAPAFTSALPPATGTAGVAYSHVFTATGAPAPAFSLTGGTLPPGLALSGALLSGTATTPGTYSGITVTAANGVPPDASQTFSIMIANTFAHYISAFGFSPADAAATADPDGDGGRNLIEYSQSTLANVPDGAGWPVVGVKSYAGTDYQFIRFTRMTTATDLTYTVQVSGDLDTWTDVASSSGGAVTSGAGFVSETGAPPLRTVEARDTTPAGGAKRFIRLKVSTP